MTTTRIITIPSGRQVTIGVYVKGWKAAKVLPSDRLVKGWDIFDVPAGEVLEDIRDGIHDRINRRLAWYGKGRKWALEYQGELSYASRQVNQPRMTIDWLPNDLKVRLAHRLRTASDY
jgi:hypothetical protein